MQSTPIKTHDRGAFSTTNSEEEEGAASPLTRVSHDWNSQEQRQASSLLTADQFHPFKDLFFFCRFGAKMIQKESMRRIFEKCGFLLDISINPVHFFLFSNEIRLLNQSIKN